jgi:hypothetical protein
MAPPHGTEDSAARRPAAGGARADLLAVLAVSSWGLSVSVTGAGITLLGLALGRDWLPRWAPRDAGRLTGDDADGGPSRWPRSQ